MSVLLQALALALKLGDSLVESHTYEDLFNSVDKVIHKERGSFSNSFSFQEGANLESLNLDEEQGNHLETPEEEQQRKRERAAKKKEKKKERAEQKKKDEEEQFKIQQQREKETEDQQKRLEKLEKTKEQLKMVQEKKKRQLIKKNDTITKILQREEDATDPISQHNFEFLLVMKTSEVEALEKKVATAKREEKELEERLIALQIRNEQFDSTFATMT